MNNNYNSSKNAKRQNPRIDGSKANENQPCLPSPQQKQQHSTHKMVNKSQHSPQQNIQMQQQQPQHQHQQQHHNVSNADHSNHQNTSFFKKVKI